jgi:hypothetical protein
MIKKYGRKIDGAWDFYNLIFDANGKPISGKEYPVPNGNNHHPGHDRLIADGRRLLVPTEYDQTTHKLVPDSYSIIDAETMRQDIIALTQEEIDNYWEEYRKSLVVSIHAKASRLITGATAHYSPSEMNQWPEMVSAAKIANDADDIEADSGDWSYFDDMVCAGISSREYGLVVLDKSQVLKDFFNAVVTARNAHKQELSATDDTDLPNYDADQLWPESFDGSSILYSLG